MLKRIRGRISCILAILLLAMAVFPNNVAAADVVSESSSDGASEDISGNSNEETADSNETDGIQQSEPEQSPGEIQGQEEIKDSEGEAPEKENPEEPLVASQGLVNYVGVDFPYLKAPGEQQIVVSFGDGTDNIADAKIICVKPDGGKLEFGLSKQENELYLFGHSFGESEAGVYKLSSFVYVRDGIEETVDLPSIGIEAMFGVNEYYPGYEAAVESETGVSADDIEISVVDVDADDVESAETDVEQAIEETVEKVEEEKESSDADDFLSKVTNKLLTAVADAVMPAATARAAEDVVVVLDPGHGGSDGGASANNLTEKDLTLKIAQYCKAELEEYNGVKVYMTRDRDVAVDLGERVNKAKNWGADVFVSIHINSATPGAKGVEVWYPNPNYNNAVHKQGQKLADDILQQLVALGLDNRGIKIRNTENNSTYPDGSPSDYYSVINNSKREGFPGIIVEHAFISNADDARKLAQESFLKQLGIADATGIASYFGLTKGISVKIEEKDDFDGTAKIQISSAGDVAKAKIQNQDTGSYKEFAVSGRKTTLQFHISDYGNARGNYSIELYNSSGKSLYSDSFYVTRDTSSTVSVESTDNKEIQYKFNISFAEMPSEVKGIQFATWSEQGGQDDLIWYQGRQSTAGSWTTTADIRNHKTAGTYYVHVYATMSNGSLKKVGTTTFAISSPALQITVGEYNQSAGTFDILLTNINSVSGVSKIEVPVWCAGNQSDIFWYRAKKQSDGSYKVTVNIANHKYAAGGYKIHTYIHTGNGMMAFTGAAPEKAVTLPELEVSAADSNGKETTYALKVINTGSLGTVKKVEFATWSEKGGQDDIVWYQGNKEDNNTWTALADIRNHKTAGNYNVHVYAHMPNGSMRFLGKTTFNVSGPSLSLEVSDYRINEGTFDITLKSVNSASGIKKIEVPVWCAGNQSDICWYEAKKQSDGSYKVEVNIANHSYAVGVYKIHTYVHTGNGMMAFAGAAPEKMITLPEMAVHAADINGKETTYALQVTNTGVLGIVKRVEFATWSERGGQDDIVWYQGEKAANNTWTATADIRNHKTAGNYNVHVYAHMPNGSLRFLGKTTFHVSEPSASGIEVRNYDPTTGCFRVVVTNPQAVSGIDKVEAPVWCAGNQSDIRWYRADRQNDGSYTVNVDPSYHKYNSGLYKIHVYVTAKNGIMSFVQGSSQLVEVTKNYTIMGETTTTVDQMMKYFESSGKSYPALELGKGGAFTLREFCQMYCDEAAAEGVRAEVAFTQAMKETGWLQYGGIVQIEQFNFAGIGALDGNSQGNCASFPDVRTGIRAQIQHLKAYGCTDPLVNPTVDPRFNKVKRGCAPYVEYLGQKENPEGLGWATSPNYGNSIVTMIKKLKSM